MLFFYENVNISDYTNFHLTYVVPKTVVTLLNFTRLEKKH